MPSTTERQVILSKPADWDSWIARIRHKATMEGVWDQINPAIYPKPPLRQEPEQPSLDLVRMELDLTQRAILLDEYKLEKEQFMIDLALYERQHKSLNNVQEAILNSIDAVTNTYLNTILSDCWEILCTFK